VTEALVRGLVGVVGASQVLTEADVVAPYAVDWSRRFSGAALAVVRPADTAEVAAVVRACVEARVPVLAQGGNTGLVGGSVPGADGPAPVIVSTRRLTRLDDVDELAGQVTAGAGVVLADLHRHASHAGWEYGVDLAARDSATVGGTIQVETVFSWPGMGQLIYLSVIRRDYPVMEACFLIFAVVVVVANFASDMVYRILDPRVRLT